MNRGHVLQSSPVQQMVAAGNPNWWNMISSMRPPPLSQYQHQPSPPPNFLPHPSNLFPQYAPSNNNYHPPNSHFLYDNQELHQESLSQLLLGGLVGEEVEKSGMSHFHELLHHQPSNNNNVVAHVKQEITSSSSYNNNNNIYGHNNHANQHDEAPAMFVSNSPNSCLTSTANPNNMLDFSGKNVDGRHPPPDRSSESNSSGGSGGGAVKKARVQPSSTQSSTSTTTFKVRKEKLGDRITALHQLVSPFGKTDTASVLLEAIGYIRFLQNQIEALSLPYLGNGSGNNIRQQHHQQSVHGERNCIFPEDPGQTCNEEPKKDLKSKGLCLVPVSCTLQVGSDNGADYWAPALGRGFQ